MIESSFINFCWDSYAKSLECKESFIEASECEFSIDQKKTFLAKIYGNLEDLKKIYTNRKDYLLKNVLLNKRSPAKITFENRFGWIIYDTNGSSFHLGKSNFSGNIKLELSPYSFFSGFNSIRGPGNLKIGSYSSIARNCEISCYPLNHPITLSQTIGPAINYRWPKAEIEFANVDYSKIDVTIENDVWIGRDVKIYPDTIISNGCVIAEDSIVKDFCEPYGIYAGKTAKLKRFRFSEKIIEALLDLQWWNCPNTVIANNRLFFETDFAEIDEFKALDIINSFTK